MAKNLRITPLEGFPINQTKNKDDCICPHCGHEFDGNIALNNDMSRDWTYCLLCSGCIKVHISIEYTCIASEW